jgi:PAS domain S-box-containing protein
LEEKTMIDLTKQINRDIGEIIKIREHILRLEGTEQIENIAKSNFDNNYQNKLSCKHINEHIFLCTCQGSLIDGNQTLLDILGYTIEEFFGMNITDLCVNPLDGIQFLDAIGKKGYIIAYRIKFKRHSGKEIDFMLTGTIRWYNEDNFPDNRPLFKVWARTIK